MWDRTIGCLKGQRWRFALAASWLAFGLFALLWGKRFLLWLVERTGRGTDAPAHLARRLLSDEVRPIFEAVFFPVSGWLVWAAGGMALALAAYQAFLVGTVEQERARVAEREAARLAAWREDAARAKRKAEQAMEEARALEARIEAEIKARASAEAKLAIDAHINEHLYEMATTKSYLADANDKVRVREAKIRALGELLASEYGVPEEEVARLTKLPY